MKEYDLRVDSHPDVSVPMKTQYYTAASLDGYIATEDNSLDWLSGSFPADAHVRVRSFKIA